MIFSHKDLIRPDDYKPGKPVTFLQEKADGIRITIIKLKAGLKAITRNGKSDFADALLDMVQFQSCLRELPTESVLDCELHCPGRPSTDIKTLINERSGALLLTPFAVPFWNSRDTRNEDWRTLRDRISLRGWTPSHTSWLFDIPTPLRPEEITRILSQARFKKIEGYVAKTAHYDGWYKLKPVRSVDAVVTGYEISDSDSFAGGLKAIVVSVYKEKKLQEIANVGSGFLAKDRMSLKPKKLVGRVCEVSYDCIAGQGRLRFPRFVRWRDDKTPEECTSDQLTH